jgi:hypothetical protein
MTFVLQSYVKIKCTWRLIFVKIIISYINVLLVLLSYPLIRILEGCERKPLDTWALTC